MSAAMNNTRMRLERLVDERARTAEKIEDALAIAEDEKRDLEEFEQTQLANYRSKLERHDEEIALLAGDLERAESSRDVSALLRTSSRREETGEGRSGDSGVVYRTFAAYARDSLIVRYPLIAQQVGGEPTAVAQAASERLQRVMVNTLSSDVAGLLPPTHISQIMDIIDASRPAVASGRPVPLTTGQLTYPRITQRPAVSKQTAEKTEAGNQKMTVVMDTVNADTYLGGGDLSWQTITWSTPDGLQLWFDLAAEEYARQTEIAACAELVASGGGTASPALPGTPTFDQWRQSVIAGIGAIYTATGGRARTNTLWVAADRFFQLAGVGSPNDVQMSTIGGVNIESMTGTFSGLWVVGSYGFAAGKAVIGDSSAFLVGENPGAPVEMRAVEPSIGGMEVGVIGAFKSKVFDTARFIHI